MLDWVVRPIRVFRLKLLPKYSIQNALSQHLCFRSKFCLTLTSIKINQKQLFFTLAITMILYFSIMRSTYDFQLFTELRIFGGKENIVHFFKSVRSQLVVQKTRCFFLIFVMHKRTFHKCG